jgi:myosin V
LQAKDRVVVKMEHALSYDKATKIWIPHPVDLWILCDIVSVNEQQGTAIVKSLTTPFHQQIINLSETQQYHPTHSHELDNLCLMNNFHEAPLLYSLRKRYEKNQIYTSIGDVLISMNPYCHIPHLYDHGISYFLSEYEEMKNGTEFVPQLISQLPPHIFHIANNALIHLLKNDEQNLTKRNMNQSIIISGESGAGKTEASKKVIQFLIDIDNYLRQQDLINSSTSSSPSSSSLSSPPPLPPPSSLHSEENHQEAVGVLINDRIWQSTYIFESFGNAKTIRNDNSSRFGKFIKLKYGTNHRLITADAEIFLLEKSRLTSISTGERNYHIFYQLFHGEHQTLDLKELSLTHISDYQILLSDDYDQNMNTSGPKVISGSYPSYPDPVHDSKEFHHLCQALSTLGCTASEMKSIWLLLASLLHLGNCYCSSPVAGGGVTEETNRSSYHEEAVIISSHSLLSIDEIAENLGVNASLLKRTLTIRVIQAMNRKSFTSKCLTVEEAEYNIKALIKHLYGHLFHWLQAMINRSFEVTNSEGGGLDQFSSYRYIGILDIFGFEIFQENSFEQLWYRPFTLSSPSLITFLLLFIVSTLPMSYCRSFSMTLYSVSNKKNMHVKELNGNNSTMLIIKMSSI